jgi:hypothetical protein
VDLMKVIKFTDLICGRLRPWTYKQEQRHVIASLERIQDDKGNTVKPPNASQIMKGSPTIGNPIVLRALSAGGISPRARRWTKMQFHHPILSLTDNIFKLAEKNECMELHQ